MRKAARKRELLERVRTATANPGANQPPAPPRKQKRDESHYHKGSCAMRLIADPEREGAPPTAWQDVKPGDFWWGREVVTIAGKEYGYRVMWAKWPDGCFGCIPIEPVPREVKESEYARPTWGFDGQLERPTLTPSIHHVGHWHGWVRAGTMQSC